MIRTRTAAALLLSAALALTACGTDDDNPVAAQAPANNAGSSAYAPPTVTENATDLTKEPKSGPGSGSVTTLQTKDLVVGKGKAAKLSDTVTVHYVGTLFADGTVFDSSWEGGRPVEFPLDRVVPGFAQGIAGMKIGGRRQIIIPAELGYRDQNIPGIPPNSTLVFVVDLRKIA